MIQNYTVTLPPIEVIGKPLADELRAAILKHPDVPQEVFDWAEHALVTVDMVDDYLIENYGCTIEAVAASLSSVVAGTTKAHSAVPIALVHYTGLHDNAPKLELNTWGALIPVLTAHRLYASKVAAPLISFVDIKGQRKGANVQAMTAIMIDVDNAVTQTQKDANGRELLDAAGRPTKVKVQRADPLSLEDARALFSEYEHVVYTTFSHTPDWHRFRVVILLPAPCPAADWPMVWAAVVQHTGSRVDLVCGDLSRMYFVPSCAPGARDDAVSWHNPGQALTWQDWAAMAPAEARKMSAKAQATSSEDATFFANAPQHVLDEKPLLSMSTETPEAVARMRSALGAIPACIDRAVWRNALWAVKAHGWPSGYQIALAWSQSCIEQFEEHAFDRDWGSFDPAREGGINAGTLYHLATQNGWHGEQAPAPKAAQQTPGAVRADVTGDIANGRTFAALLRGRMLYCHAAKKWLRWDGSFWRWCTAGEHVAAAKHIADRIVEHAAAAWSAAPTVREKMQLLKAAQALHGNAPRLEAMLAMASSEEGMGIASPADLDADPMMLGVRNGVLNLKTGTLLQADPAMLISRCAGAAFDRNAKAPKFLQLLHDAFGGDQDMIDFILRAIGYTLTGRVSEEALFFAFGQGANGKSVLANILCGLLGDYAITVSSEMLAVSRNGGGNAARGDIVQLSGARLVLANETRAGELWDDAMIKRLVTTERISARANYGEPFSFSPTHKLWVRGNNKPGLRDTTDGTWRRINLIEFNHQVPESRRVLDLHEIILRDERDGVLALAVEACVEWQRQGLNAPAKVRDATRQYRDDCDEIGEWLTERTERQVGAKATTENAFGDYFRWANAAGLRGMARKAFSRAVLQRGFTATKVGTQNGIAGLRLTGYGAAPI